MGLFNRKISPDFIAVPAEHDALDEHEACAAICLDLVSNPDMTMVGLAAAVAILAVKMHRAGGDAR
jgi:hypothetical protein